MEKGPITAFIRTFFFAGSPVALAIIAKTGISADDYVLYYNVALTLLPAAIVTGYELYIDWRNRPDVIVKKAEDLPSVSKVVIAKETDGEIAKLAASEDHPKVVKEEVKP